MKTCLSFLAALVALLSSAGCGTSQGARKKNLPPDWIAALPKSGSPVAEIAGVFVELGERLDERYTRDGTVNNANLALFLSSRTLKGGIVRRPPDRGATVELRRTDDTHLELITRVNDEVTRRVTLEVEFEKDTGTIVLHRGQFLASGGEFLAAGYEALNFRLWHAPDGRLYARGTRRGVGEMMLVPFVYSTEVWCRWDPATPEALQRQAAALAKQPAAVELSRRTATVGAKVPAFSATDVLTGRLVTSADYEGKVVLLHFWSTGTSSRVLKPLHAAYAKHHARGLEIIGLCINRANEREKVVDFIKSKDLTWPQHYDGKGSHGELFEACYLTLAPFCVIDRQGNIGALVASVDGIDAAVAAALAAP